MLTSLAAHLLVRLVEEDVVDARGVLEVHGAVAQLQVVFLTHPGGRSTSSLQPPSAASQNNQIRKYSVFSRRRSLAHFRRGRLVM